MNSVDEILIKYKFTDSPLDSNKLENVVKITDKKISKYRSKIKKARKTQVNKELKMINEIIDLADDNIIDRIDYNLLAYLKEDYIVGECFEKIYQVKKDLKKSINKQVKKEEKLIESIKKDIKDEEFVYIENKLKSDEFLKYISQKHNNK